MRAFTILVPIVVAAAGAASFWWVSGSLSAPRPAPIGPAPPTLRAENIEFTHPNGAVVRGWVATPEETRAVVLLLHGVRANRLQMLPRAQFLHSAGYAVALLDFQGHGESSGDRITFGFREADDVRLALAHLRDRFAGLPVGVIGNSLGGAATVLGETPADVEAVVLEAVYPDIERAISNRLALRLGPPGRFLTPLLTLQLRPRLGVDPDALRPVRAIAQLQAPLLVVAGADDAHTTLAETQELFAAAREPKELWIVEDAQHEDLHSFARVEYERRVLEFFERYLGSTTTGAG